MSQRGEDFDFSLTNAQNSIQNSGSQQQQQQNKPLNNSTQFAPPTALTAPPPPPLQPPQSNSVAPSQFNPAAQMPPPSMYWDWPYYGMAPNVVPPFDMSDLNRNPNARQTTTGSSANAAASNNRSLLSAAANTPGPSALAPFMDTSYLYYMQMQLAAAAAAAYGPYGPYGMGMMPPPMPFPPRSQIADDQQSIQSFHFDTDARSDRHRASLLLANNRAQSIAGDFKQEPLDPTSSKSSKGVHHHQSQAAGGGGLLIEDPGAAAAANVTDASGGANNLIVDSSMVAGGVGLPVATTKRDENRMTPLTHQLPHVRASFSLNAMLKVRANDPCEGQPALVDIINLGDLMEHFLSNLKNMKINESMEFGNELMNDEYEPNANDISEDMRNEILTNYKLMQEFPGPLVKDTTSKAQVIQFCQKNVKECLSNSNVNLIDPQSHALLWDYLALLVRQNGIFDLKTDISPLLLSGIADSSQPVTSSSSTTTAAAKPTIPIKQSPSSSSLIQQQQDFVMVNNEDQNNPLTGSASTTEVTTTKTGQQQQQQSQPQQAQQQQQQQQHIDEEAQHLNKLRQLLGAGQKTDAIDLAIKYNMWPHALFLASSFNNTAAASNTTNILASSNNTTMISLTSGGGSSGATSAAAAQQQMEPKLLHKVKVRFINSLQPNDPIHTCYQLLIGRVPSIASNVAKAEWNDWRRHLAMIVSNVDDNNRDLVYTTIKTMGDSLASNGRVAASHFCYLLSNCAFGTYNKKSSKLVLIGSSHNQEYSKFCQISAIQATEVYEFANSLSATRSPTSPLSTNGILEHFVKYKLAYTTRLIEYGLINEAYKYIEVIAKSVNLNPKLHADKISPVYHLSNRLRIYDPDFNTSDDGSSGVYPNEPTWLQELTNNFKKQHLSKYSNLLSNNNASSSGIGAVSDTTSSLAVAATANEPITSTINVVSTATAQPHYLQQQQQQQQQTLPQQYEQQNTIDQHYQQQQPQYHPEVDMMSKLSLNNMPTGNQYDQQQQQPVGYVQSQSMSFAPSSSASIDYTVQSSHHQQQQSQQPQQQFEQHHSQYLEPSQIQQQQQQQHQYYQPIQTNNSDQQQQQQQQPQTGYFNPGQQQQPQQASISASAENLSHQHGYHQASVSQSRKSSVASASNYNISTAGQHQTTTSRQRNISTSSTSGLETIGGYNNAPPPPPPAGHQQQNRSRESSVSSQMPPPPSTFVPFSAYHQTTKPAAESAPAYFDPSSTTLTKSQTFPTHHQHLFQPHDQQQQQQQIKEEPVSNEPSDHNDEPPAQTTATTTTVKKKPYYFDDDEDDQFKTPAAAAGAAKQGGDAAGKNALNQQEQNKSWLGRALNYIKPANAPKKMILPDDRKKTIVWDDKLKRYVNKDSSGGGEASETVKPPPLGMPLPQSQSQPTALSSVSTSAIPPSSSASAAVDNNKPNPTLPPGGEQPQQNRFSLKSASKTNYYSKLDYFANADPNKKSSGGPAAAAASAGVDPKVLLSNMPPPSQMPPRFFVPEPVANPMAGLDSPPQPEQQPQAQQQQQQQSNTQMFIPGNQDHYHNDQQQQQQQQQYHHQYNTYAQAVSSSGSGGYYQQGNYGGGDSDENGGGTSSANDSPGSSNNDSTGSSNSYNQHYQGGDQHQSAYGNYQHFHSNI